MDELNHRATTRQCSFELLATVDHYDQAIVPTERDISDLMAASKAGRGHGEDGLCAELFKEFRDIMAPLLWPIWLKNDIEAGGTATMDRRHAGKPLQGQG